MYLTVAMPTAGETTLLGGNPKSMKRLLRVNGKVSGPVIPALNVRDERGLSAVGPEPAALTIEDGAFGRGLALTIEDGAFGGV